MHPKNIFQCLLYFKTYISGGILYLSFCNLLFSLNILFLRIIHVDVQRKLNITSESKNIPAHRGKLETSPGCIMGTRDCPVHTPGSLHSPAYHHCCMAALASGSPASLSQPMSQNSTDS